MPVAEQISANEMMVLKAFWRHGPLSSRELHDRLGERHGWTISTTRTVLDRMRGKGLLTRTTVHGMGVYAAAGSKVQILGSVIRNFARGILEVDGNIPMAAFSGSALLSEQDLDDLAQLVNDESPEP